MTLHKALLEAYSRLLQFVETDESQVAQWPTILGVKRVGDREVRASIETLLSKPTTRDERVSALRALREFDEIRPADSKERNHQYRVANALWASKYEILNGRRPRPDGDWEIMFPEENE